MKSYAGAAIKTSITADIAAGATSIVIAESDGWSTGAGAKPFVVALFDGEGNGEKILIASRSGTTLTVSSRGYDGTVPLDFASGSVIYQVWDAASATTFADHIGPSEDPADPHATTLLNVTRHAAAAHEFGAGKPLGDPALPATVRATAVKGTSPAAAHADHAHALDAAIAGDGLALVTGVLKVLFDTNVLVVTGDTLSIKSGGVVHSLLAVDAVERTNIKAGEVVHAALGAAAVEGTNIADATIAAAKLIDGIITQAKMATGLRVPFVGASAPGSPAVGDQWFKPSTSEMFVYYGATTGWKPPWNLAWGEVGQAKQSAGITGITTGSTLCMTGDILMLPNRKYETSWEVPSIQKQGAGVGEVQIIVVDGALATLKIHRWSANDNDLDSKAGGYREIGANATVKRGLRGLTNTNTVDIGGTNTLAEITVKDIGSSGAAP